MIPAWWALAACGEPLPGPCDGRDARGFRGSVAASLGTEAAFAADVHPTRRVEAWTVDLNVAVQNAEVTPCAVAVYAAEDAPDLSLVAPFDAAVPPPEEHPDLGRLLGSALLSERWFVEDTGYTGGTAIANGTWMLDLTVADGPPERQVITVVACENVSVTISAHVWSCAQALEDRVAGDEL